jgi:hypothetical protein
MLVACEVAQGCQDAHRRWAGWCTSSAAACLLRTVNDGVGTQHAASAYLLASLLRRINDGVGTQVLHLHTCLRVFCAALTTAWALKCCICMTAVLPTQTKV